MNRLEKLKQLEARKKRLAEKKENVVIEVKKPKKVARISSVNKELDEQKVFRKYAEEILKNTYLENYKHEIKPALYERFKKLSKTELIPKILALINNKRAPISRQILIKKLIQLPTFLQEEFLEEFTRQSNNYTVFYDLWYYKRETQEKLQKSFNEDNFDYEKMQSFSNIFDIEKEIIEKYKKRLSELTHEEKKEILKKYKNLARVLGIKEKNVIKLIRKLRYEGKKLLSDIDIERYNTPEKLKNVIIELNSNDIDLDIQDDDTFEIRLVKVLKVIKQKENENRRKKLEEKRQLAKKRIKSSDNPIDYEDIRQITKLEEEDMDKKLLENYDLTEILKDVEEKDREKIREQHIQRKLFREKLSPNYLTTFVGSERERLVKKIYYFYNFPVEEKEKIYMLTDKRLHSIEKRIDKCVYNEAKFLFGEKPMDIFIAKPNMESLDIKEFIIKDNNKKHIKLYIKPNEYDFYRANYYKFFGLLCFSKRMEQKDLILTCYIDEKTKYDFVVGFLTKGKKMFSHMYKLSQDNYLVIQDEHIFREKQEFIKKFKIRQTNVKKRVDEYLRTTIKSKDDPVILVTKKMLKDILIYYMEHVEFGKPVENVDKEKMIQLRKYATTFANKVIDFWYEKDIPIEFFLYEIGAIITYFISPYSKTLRKKFRLGMLIPESLAMHNIKELIPELSDQGELIENILYHLNYNIYKFIYETAFNIIKDPSEKNTLSYPMKIYPQIKEEYCVNYDEKSNKLGETVFYKDNGKVYCFSLKEIEKLFLSENYINPATGKHFSKEFIDRYVISYIDPEDNKKYTFIYRELYDNFKKGDFTNKLTGRQFTKSFIESVLLSERMKKIKIKIKGRNKSVWDIYIDLLNKKIYPRKVVLEVLSQINVSNRTIKRLDFSLRDCDNPRDIINEKPENVIKYNDGKKTECFPVSYIATHEKNPYNEDDVSFSEDHKRLIEFKKELEREEREERERKEKEERERKEKEERERKERKEREEKEQYILNIPNMWDVVEKHFNTLLSLSQKSEQENSGSETENEEEEEEEENDEENDEETDEETEDEKEDDKKNDEETEEENEEETEEETEEENDEETEEETEEENDEENDEKEDEKEDEENEDANVFGYPKKRKNKKDCISKEENIKCIYCGKKPIMFKSVAYINNKFEIIGFCCTKCMEKYIFPKFKKQEI